MKPCELRFGPASAAALIAAALLAGCTPSPAPQRDYILYRASGNPIAVSEHVSEQVRACWFGADRASFAGYAYTPEIDSGRARVLVVPANDPTGLPKLVVESTQAGYGTDVKLFGPLLAGPQGARIQADVARWSAGTAGC
ncbi:hypothetical protein [Propylenella binzhouense]|uniref:Lipoprotein n=1 Tax=Propylenella binzhouense TaxID=2555902 RepID=A0A964T578_9HYPH|nr:hypothetical protein [Propylenella binzhouense]MYZ48074.1 hypothetical protein [Propylenella binzhouense]